MSTGSSKLDLSILLFLYLTDGFVGRQTLAEEFELGEGKIKTHLKGLKEKGYITQLRAGSQLTEKGYMLINGILEALSVERLGFTDGRELGSQTVLYLLLRKESVPSKIVKMRDQAVKEGADGAIIGIFSGDTFRLPPGNEDLCMYAPLFCTKIKPKIIGEPPRLTLLAVFGDKKGKTIEGLVAILLSEYSPWRATLLGLLELL
jgi:biotin operon repressor